MKKLAFGLFLFVGLICRSDAQLDGEYTYNIADIFGKSIYCNEDGPDYGLTIIGNGSLDLGTTSFHNPKTGAFRVTGNTEFGEGTNQFQPIQFNPSLPDTDYFALTSSPTIVVGKTYTNKQTGRAVLDISSGSIGLLGQYDVGLDTEVLVGIKKGSLGFKGKNLDLETAMKGDGVNLTVSGSAVLNNKTTKRFNNTLQLYFGYWGDEPYIGEIVGSERYSQYSSFYLDLNLTTTGSNVTGYAEVFYSFTTTGLETGYSNTFYHPDVSDQSKRWRYSVKGTRKNGVSTLILTGLGAISGLKANIYIDENTEEIIPNGKNSITLYGQTIKY